MPTRDPLPGAARVLLAGSLLEAFGTGLVLPFLLIYLHAVRSVPLGTTGALLAIPGLVGFVVGPVGGALADRLGPRRVVLAGLAASASGTALLAAVHGPPLAVPALLLVGGGQATFFGTQNALFGRIATGPVLQRMYATHFVLLNAGIGLGGLAGGAFADVHRPRSFVVLYLIDALTFVAYAVVLSTLRIRGDRVHADAASGSYREVFRHPLAASLVGLSVLLAVVGYAAVDSGLPALATVSLGLPPRAVAAGLVANTAMIVLGQLLVLRFVERMRRTRAIVCVGAFWAAAWLLLGSTELVGPHPLRWVVVIAFGMVFGLGETFMAPTVPPLTGAIAPPHLHGRFFALMSLSYSLAFTVGPPLATTLIGHHAAGAWIGLMAGGCVGVAVLALRLERRLSPEDNRSLPVTDPGLVLSRSP